MNTTPLVAVHPADTIEKALRCDALRLLHLDLLANGLHEKQLYQWAQATAFPHLRFKPQIFKIYRAICAYLHLDTDLHPPCEPQIVYRWPDRAEAWDAQPHTDDPPEWADGRKYSHIVGVALTDWTAESGTPRCWLRGLDAPPTIVPVPEGGLIILDPTLPHASGLNRTGMPRVGIYYRFLGGR